MRARTFATAAMAAMAATVFAASPAAAATLTVDDDLGQCPHAGYQSIQAAVDAAPDNSVIRVCHGVYNEVVSVPRGKEGLRFGKPGGQAAIIDPTGVQTSDPARAGLIIRGDRTAVIGLQVTGAAPHPSFDCPAAPAAGIMVLEGRTYLDRVNVNNFADLSCPGGRVAGIRGGVPAGLIPTEAPAVLRVDRSEVTQLGGTAVEFSAASGALMRSRIANSRFGVFAGDTTGAVVIRSNQFSDMEEMAVSFARATPLRILTNRMDRNGYGIYGVESGGAIERNTIRASTIDGIALQDTDFLVRRNSALGSGRADCNDLSGTPLVDRWIDNVGVTQFPEGICRPPAR